MLNQIIAKADYKPNKETEAFSVEEYFRLVAKILMIKAKS